MSRPPIMMMRTRHGLSPTSAYDSECLDAYAIGATVEVTVRQRRSDRNHRHFWVVLARLVEAGAVPFNTTEEFVDALKMACGVTELRLGIGGPYIVPGSISYAARDEASFKAFKEKAFALVASHYGIDPAGVIPDVAA